MITRKPALALTQHRGVQAISTKTNGILLTANNFSNLPANMNRFIGSYWYWHTTAITTNAGQTLLRAGRLLAGGDGGQFLMMDHLWQTSGNPCLQFGVSGPLLQQPPYQYDDYFWSGSIPTGNIGWNNMIFGIDLTLQNPARFILNGAPIAANNNSGPNYDATITAELVGHPVWHLSSGLGGRHNTTPQSPFKGYLAEFIMYDMSNVTWVDPLSIVGNFYDANNESPPPFDQVDPKGLQQSPVPGLAPLFYFRGPKLEYVFRNHMGTITGGQLAPDTNETLVVSGGSFDTDAPSDPWGFVGS